MLPTLAGVVCSMPASLGERRAQVASVGVVLIVASSLGPRVANRRILLVMSVHVRTPGELIASLPVLLGFVPIESVVIVGLGASGRVAPVVRLDRGDCLIPELAQSVATAVVGHLARARSTGVVLVSFRHGGSPLTCSALDALRPLLGGHVEVVDAWVVAGNRFRAPECPDPGCCPDGGRAVPSAPEGLPPYRPALGFTHGSRDTRGPMATGVRRKRARASFQRARNARARAHLLSDGGVEDGHSAKSTGSSRSANVAPLTQWRLDKLEEWRTALGRAATGMMPSDAATGRLAAGLCDIVVRDAAVIAMVPGREKVAKALCGDPTTNGVREALAVMIAAEHSERPADADVYALVALAEHVASLSDDGAAPALTLAGLALWWSGEHSMADHVIARALACEPGYRLAELVACALDAHMPPGWIAAA